jgi:hypothetical protein
MASIHKEFPIDAKPEDVWDALRDFGALHTRLAVGFVTDTQVEPDGAARLVTFANGTTAREILVTMDDERRRLVYAVAANERIRQHSATVQVFAEGANQTRFVWIADVLPNEIAAYIDEQMEMGAAAIRKMLERRPHSPS